MRKTTETIHCDLCGREFVKIGQFVANLRFTYEEIYPNESGGYNDNYQDICQKCSHEIIKQLAQLKANK